MAGRRQRPVFEKGSAAVVDDLRALSPDQARDCGQQVSAGLAGAFGSDGVQQRRQSSFGFAALRKVDERIVRQQQGGFVAKAFRAADSDQAFWASDFEALQDVQAALQGEQVQRGADQVGGAVMQSDGDFGRVFADGGGNDVPFPFGQVLAGVVSQRQGQR